jgi:hypothetical protein
MPGAQVFFVGTAAEVAHQAEPLRRHVDVQVAPPDEVVRQSRPGDLAIFYSEHFDRFRECVGRLAEKSVATIYAIDGILEWRNAWENRENEPACPWTMRPALADKVACIGENQARILRQWGNDNVEVIGLPRLDPWLVRNRPSASVEPANRTLRLLIMTAKWPGFTPEQQARTLRSLADLRDWLAQHPSVGGRPIEVTWRLTHGLERDLLVPNSLSETTGGELVQVLTRVDAVITTPSTAMLEAMLFGLPTATLDYHGVPMYVQPAWTIQHAGAIAGVVSQLASPAPSRIHYQEMLLHDELACQGSASARMADLIRRMQAVAADRLAQNRPLAFPARLVSPEPDPVVELPMAELFPAHAAFLETSIPRLRAELAHARREISLLQAEIEQLRGELGQAHRIFDQVHRHPIAGPIVRLRQKLIDRLAQLTNRKAELEQAEKS